MSDFNQEQRKAIELRNKTILVSAPAGSGKTRILVSRIDDLIKKDLYQIKEFLVLTFTEAAGMEMKQRLNEQLHQDLKDQSLDESIRIHIKAQILDLPSAYITTFDSFCAELLKKYGYLINIMPGFEILSSPETLQKEAMEECLNKWILDSQFQDYISRYNINNHFDNFISLIIHYHSVTASFVDFETFLSHIYKKYYSFNQIEDSSLFQLIKEIFYDALDETLSNYNNLYQFVLENSIEPFFDTDKNGLSTKEAYDQYFDNITHISVNSYKDLENILHMPLKLPRISWKDYSISPKDKESFTKLKSAVLQPLKKLSDKISIVSLDDFKDLLQYTFKDIYYLLGKDGLLQKFQEVFRKKKQEQNMLDFHDLEDYASQLLDKPEVKDKLHNLFKEIMIDEYQDTNQIQENLVLKIAQGNTDIPMFMVGDMKQSIYRFRQADPSIFKYKFDHFIPLEQSNQDDHNIRIDLKYNYRSQKAVLDCINYIFDCIMDEKIGGLKYLEDPNAQLRYDYQTKHTTLADLKDNHEYDTDIILAVTNNDHTYTKAEIEAHMIAKKILSLKNSYEYKDIAVLMRSTTDFITFKKVFESYKIPANITLSKGLHDAPEIKALIALLKAIHNPYDDISLLSVLHNHFSFSSFNENELFGIRQYTEPMKPLYLDLQSSSLPKVRHFLEVFEHLRTYSCSHNAYETLIESLRLSAYQEFVSALINGEQRSANIDALTELLRNDKSPYLKDTLAKLENNTQAAPGVIASDDSNSVSFMTIHKSKGLQFKVVFVANLQKRFNKSDETPLILLDKEVGIGSKARIYKKSEFGPILTEIENPYRHMIAHYIHKNALDEEMRILYVALTRAENKLILSGVIDNQEQLASLEKKVKINDTDETAKPSSVILNKSIRSTNNYLQWILASVLRNKNLNTDETALAYFHLHYYEINDIISQHSLASQSDHSLYQTYQAYYSYVYPYKDYHRSIAVTKKQALEDEKHFEYFDTANKNRTDALSLGTLVHNVLSFLDFKSDEDIIDKLSYQDFFNEEDYRKINDYKSHILSFIHSDTYQLIKESDTIYKEKPFLYKDHDEIIKGIFDLVFIKDQTVSVLDYKTDRITPHTGNSALVNKHRIQLEYYKKVLKAYYPGYKVQGYVYYLETGKLVEV